MLKAILLMVMTVSVLSTGSSRIAVASSLDLSQFHWKNRLLFLFAPNRDHPLFDTLHTSLAAQKAEAADRDLVIFEILESGPSSMNAANLDFQTVQSLWEKFDLPRGEFTVLLIGKDGGIKLNYRDPIRLEDIFALIDAMPMRQEEMRRKRIGESGAAETNESGGVE